MPSISTALSKEESSRWRRYFRLVRDLREYAIWRYEEDGKPKADGSQRPPRFVAVVEDERRFHRLMQRAEVLGEMNTTWPPRFYDEIWGWGRVHVGTGSRSVRLPPGLPADVAGVEPKKGELVAPVISALEARGHEARVADGRLIVTPGPAGLTARQGGGRAFKLRVWSESGELLHTLAVGAVVCRGVRQGITEGGGPRKQRSDALKQFAGFGGVSFWE